MAVGEDFENSGYLMAKYNPKILVVDDNEDNRYTLHRRLKKDGYSEISLANGGQEALDIV